MSSADPVFAHDHGYTCGRPTQLEGACANGQYVRYDISSVTCTVP